MQSVEQSVEVVQTREVRIDDEPFELRVEREDDGQLRATAFHKRRMLKFRQGATKLITPLRHRHGAQSKPKVESPEGRLAADDLLRHLEIDLRTHHAMGSITFD